MERVKSKAPKSRPSIDESKPPILSISTKEETPKEWPSTSNVAPVTVGEKRDRRESLVDATPGAKRAKTEPETLQERRNSVPDISGNHFNHNLSCRKVTMIPIAHLCMQPQIDTTSSLINLLLSNKCATTIVCHDAPGLVHPDASAIIRDL